MLECWISHVPVLVLVLALVLCYVSALLRHKPSLGRRLDRFFRSAPSSAWLGWWLDLINQDSHLITDSYPIATATPKRSHVRGCCSL